MTTIERRFRIGELAEATGLTVRTLHHYDEIGLLSPSARTEAGHRIYAGEDIARLYRIVALKQLGLGLEEVRACLEETGADPRAVVRRQLDELDRRLRLQRELKVRLEWILHALDRAEEPTTKDFLDALEVMKRMEKHYTPEQLAQLEQRRNEIGTDGIKRAEQEWQELIAAVETERAAGSDPAGSRMQDLASKWIELIERFTGGDPGIRQSLQKMYEEEGTKKASRGMVSPELMAYAQEAIAARGSSK